MLGKLVKDRVTGYQGRVTGRAEYLTGCAQLLVQPNAKPDGEFVDGRWLDETRVELMPGSQTLSIPGAASDPGADVSAPIK